MDIQKIFQKQKHQSFLQRSQPISIRKKRIKKIYHWIVANQTKIEKAVYEDLKKSPEETQIAEIFVVLSEIRKTLQKVKYWSLPEKVPSSMPFWGTRASVYYEPKGTVLIISPWNYPFSLSIGPLVAALAAGNTAFLKPSEFSKHTSALLLEMASTLFDEKEVVVCLGDSQMSQKLLTFPFDHIFFTGSPRVGKLVMKAAALHLSSVTLELGGKSPCIVDSSAHLKDAAEKIAWGKWLNAGQTCLAPDIVFVHQSIQKSFLDELKKQALRLYAKNYSSIISTSHFERLKSWKKEALVEGQLILDGALDQEKLKMAPTIIVNPNKNCELAQSEIFGPLCYVVTFDKIEDVIADINARPKALSLYVFARNASLITKLKMQTSSGSLVVNENVLQFAHPNLPFGGVNGSGIGKSHGKYGFLAFTHQKAVLKQRVGFTMAKILYPPYNNFKRLNIKFLLKYF